MTLGCLLRFLSIFCLFVLCAITQEAHAHRTDESYLYFSVTDAELSGRFEITTKDLGLALDLDSDGDGAVSIEEVELHADTIYAYLTPRLSLESEDGSHHPIEITGHTFFESEPGMFTQIWFDVPTLGPPPERLIMTYRFLFDGADPSHRGFALIESNTRVGIQENESQISVIFGPGEEQQLVYLDGAPWPMVLWEFVGHGVWHILIGYDHILFILTLLLPAVLILRHDGWVPGASFRQSFVFVVKVISIFTIAHSITLSLSTLGILTLPVRLVEAIIAISIAVVALNNIIPFMREKSWIVVFVFGMFHGFGFANVLDPLGINQQSMIAALAGFNIGVELGQILIILVVFPVLFMLREWSLYRPLILRFGSAGLILVAAFWFVERTYDLLGPVTETLFGVSA